MPRVIWKGAVSFSLIHIPVALHAASREQSLSFDTLDRRDYAPIGYQRINKGSGKPVEWADIVKGYEYEKGEYVVLSDEDFRQANVDDLMRRIDEKVQSGQTKALPPAAAKATAIRTAEVIDLGELLKRSLAERRSGSARRTPPAAASRPRGRSAGTRRRRA